MQRYLDVDDDGRQFLILKARKIKNNKMLLKLRDPDNPDEPRKVEMDLTEYQRKVIRKVTRRG